MVLQLVLSKSIRGNGGINGPIYIRAGGINIRLNPVIICFFEGDTFQDIGVLSISVQSLK